MDPFSITASTLTVITAAIATGRGLKKLVSLNDAPNELYQLHNEVSDVRHVLAKCDLLEKAAHADHHDFDLEHLRRLRGKTLADLDELSSLLRQVVENFEDVVASDTSDVEIEFSHRSWLKRLSKAKQICQNLREDRININQAMVQLNTSSLPKTHVKLAELSVITTGLEGRVNAVNTTSLDHFEMTRDVLVPTILSIAHRMDALELERHISDTPSSAIELVPDIACTELTPSPDNRAERPNVPASTDGANSLDTDPRTLDSRALSSRRSSSTLTAASSPSTLKGDNFAVEVKTDMYEAHNCPPLCGCQCHLVSTVRVAPCMTEIIGSLFVGYSGIPLLQSRRCNDRTCQQERGTLVRVTYFFPSWLWHRMISFVNRSHPLDGYEIFLKVPRVVASSSDIFTMAQKGNIVGLQALFSMKKASIYDVSEAEGRSALHFALTAKKPAVCTFLLSQRINHLTEDKNMLSAVDLVWNYLLQDPTTEENKAIKIAFSRFLNEAEDLLKRGFNAVHRIVFGLSMVDLDSYLELNAAEIDGRCSLGRTALCWASLRRHPHHVRSLVRAGAALNIADVRGQLPLHFASETGVAQSLQVLLRAAACMLQDGTPSPDFKLQGVDWDNAESFVPEVSDFCRTLLEQRDYKGRTALHFAARNNQVEQASLLLRYGAHVDSPDVPLARTPLLLAIYWNHHDVVSLLLSHHARVDVVDARGCTVLHYMARFGDYSTLRLLQPRLVGGVSPECRDAENKTPLEAFELDRPLFLSEENSLKAQSRNLFMQILRVLELHLLYDSDASDVDIWMDAVSSLEASISSMDELHSDGVGVSA